MFPVKETVVGDEVLFYGSQTGTVELIDEITNTVTLRTGPQTTQTLLGTTRVSYHERRYTDLKPNEIRIGSLKTKRI